MATFQNRTGADGTRRVKAIARVWLNGKQVNKIKTFSEKDGDDYEQEARGWAEQVENNLKAEKARLLYQSTAGASALEQGTELKLNITPLQGKTLGDYLIQLKEATEQLYSQFGHIELGKSVQINTNQVWKYIMSRYEVKASKQQIESELQLLRDLILQLNPSQKTDIVGLALQAAQADGADFPPD
ncbi:MAG: hypothetical protein ACR2PX_10380 [Endozoicomonas sp.]|uniref:hypothetical protein n=1 Tax=Endozoicomonas sp. TaxID=1892382 RepID=UPI003D9AD1B0